MVLPQCVAHIMCHRYFNIFFLFLRQIRFYYRKYWLKYFFCFFVRIYFFFLFNKILIRSFQFICQINCSCFLLLFLFHLLHFGIYEIYKNTFNRFLIKYLVYVCSFGFFFCIQFSVCLNFRTYSKRVLKHCIQHSNRCNAHHI